MRDWCTRPRLGASGTWYVCFPRRSLVVSPSFRFVAVVFHVPSRSCLFRFTVHPRRSPVNPSTQPSKLRARCVPIIERVRIHVSPRLALSVPLADFHPRSRARFTGEAAPLPFPARCPLHVETQATRRRTRCLPATKTPRNPVSVCLRVHSPGNCQLTCVSSESVALRARGKWAVAARRGKCVRTRGESFACALVLGCAVVSPSRSFSFSSLSFEFWLSSCLDRVVGSGMGVMHDGGKSSLSRQIGEFRLELLRTNHTHFAFSHCPSIHPFVSLRSSSLPGCASPRCTSIRANCC